MMLNVNGCQESGMRINKIMKNIIRKLEYIRDSGHNVGNDVSTVQKVFRQAMNLAIEAVKS